MIPISWLEDIEGERAPARVASQPARTLEHFGGTKFERDPGGLTAIFDQPDNKLWRDARNLPGIWRRTKLTAYMTADPQGELPLDLEAKGSINWLDPDRLKLSSALGDGMATRCGYARSVRLWKRRADPLTAPVIFETDSEFIGVSGHLDRTAESGRLWFIEHPASSRKSAESTCRRRNSGIAQRTKKVCEDKRHCAKE